METGEGVSEGVRKGEVNSPGPGRQLGDVVRENNRQTDGRTDREVKRSQHCPLPSEFLIQALSMVRLRPLEDARCRQ